MNRFIIQLLASALLVATLVNCQGQKDTAQTVQEEELEGTDYTGEWESVVSENLGNGTFGTRYFNLESEHWEVRFTLYLDSLQTMPVFEFRGVGPYEVEGKSETLEWVDNAIFHFDHKYVTLLTDNADLINNFGFTACNLETGVEKDITEEGCSFLVSKAVCGQEYDLLKLENEQLFFGMRPAEGDMCAEERRPTALFYPLKRK